MKRIFGIIFLKFLKKKDKIDENLIVQKFFQIIDELNWKLENDNFNKLENQNILDKIHSLVYVLGFYDFVTFID
jgi:hypothetical protein